VSEMLDYAFAQYEIHNLLGDKKVVGKYEIDKAKKKYVDIIPNGEVTILKKKGEKLNNVKYDVILDKLKAPIKSGDSVGTLEIKENNKLLRSVDLTVKESIKKANLLELYIRYIKDIFVSDTFIKN